MTHIYTDGACSGNPGRGGWGYVIVNDLNDIIYTDGGYEENTTNQRMELTAAIEALNKAMELGIDLLKCQLYSDSAYLVNCKNDKWYANWEKNGWVNAKRQPIANKDLWEKLTFFLKSDIMFIKVKGHADNLWNNYVDAIATTQISKK